MPSGISLWVVFLSAREDTLTRRGILILPALWTLIITNTVRHRKGSEPEQTDMAVDTRLHRRAAARAVIFAQAFSALIVAASVWAVTLSPVVDLDGRI